MLAFSCHDCGEALPEGREIWLAPDSGRPDEAGGEPYCPSCASPLGIAA